MDKQESFFRSLWKDEIYICRTWDYYLEFLNPHANKGDGLTALAESYGLGIDDVIAFGDASNDIPMLKSAGLGIAVGNASDEVKAAAKKVSEWTNDQDAVAKEWEILKKPFLSVDLKYRSCSLSLSHMQRCANAFFVKQSTDCPDRQFRSIMIAAQMTQYYHFRCSR
jgi:predicted Fe-Mo cluster-binding NifX family protein